jgi:hypothetical protein
MEPGVIADTVERRLILYARGVANSIPNPSVSAVKPIARVWNGLTSSGMVAARGGATTRTYPLPPEPSAGAGGESLAANNAGLDGCAAERSRGGELLSMVSVLSAVVGTSHLGRTIPRSGPVYGTYEPYTSSLRGVGGGIHVGEDVVRVGVTSEA